MSNSSKIKIAVVGGGLFGGCVAYELAKAGAEVTVIERDPVGVHASGRNPGNLNPILATPAKLQPLALVSFQMHETLRQELAQLGCQDYGIEAVRRILVCFNDEECRELESVARQFVGQSGFSAQWLDADAVRSTDTRISSEIVAGLLLEGNRSLDSLAFNRALLEGAAKHGMQLLSTDAKGIDHRSGGGHTVRTGLGNLECDAVVLASGPWVVETREWLGLDLPVQPVKGELLRMRLPGDNITYDYTQGLISLYRRGEDEVWVGVTREACGFDEQPSDAGRLQLIEGAARIMPAIAEAQLIKHLASLRPMAPGGLPLIGPVPSMDNVYVANGGGIKGVLICAAIGRAVADMMLTGQTDLPVDDFALG